MLENWVKSCGLQDDATIDLVDGNARFGDDEYYRFELGIIRFAGFDIYVHKVTGELFQAYTSDSSYVPQGRMSDHLVPIDNWYYVTFESHNDSFPDSTMSIRDHTLPPDQLVGAIFGVRGIIESNYPITSVTVAVYNDRGVEETGMTVYPNEYSYDIRNLDYDILFDILTPGKKTYVITATDAMATRGLEHEFWVNSR